MISKEVMDAARRSLENPGESFAELPKAYSGTEPVLFLFRHGSTVDNEARIFSGWRNAALSPKGIKNAEILAEKLKNFRIDMGIHSHLSRSFDTLKIALRNHPNVKFVEDDRIIERNYGDLAGTSKTELMKKNPEEAILFRRGYDYPPPNGESLKMVEGRVFPFCEELVNRMKTEKINVAISSHSNSMRVIRRYFEEMTIDQMCSHENPLGEDYVSYIIK